MRPVRPPGAALACSGICLQNGGNRSIIVSAWGEVDHGRVARICHYACPGSDTAALICSGQSACVRASIELVGEGGHWTLDTPLTSLSDLAPVANSSARYAALAEQNSVSYNSSPTRGCRAYIM